MQNKESCGCGQTDKGIEESIRRLGYKSMHERASKKVIELLITGNDVFAVLPTGYGKSLYYLNFN